MEKFFILVLCVFSFHNLISQKKVLIIGNSLMYYNSLEKTLSDVLNSNHNDSCTYEVNIIAHSGISLMGHLNNYYLSDKRAIDYIKLKELISRGWSVEKLKKTYKFDLDLDTINASSLELHLIGHSYDYIIIQEHGSMIESEILAKYCASKSVLRLSELLRRTENKDAKVYFFTEYPTRKAYSSKKPYQRVISNTSRYDTISCYPLEKKDSLLLDKRFSLLHDSFSYSASPEYQIERYVNNLEKVLSKQKQYTITPTAEIFHLLKLKYPKLKLHALGGHPSKAASYSFALVFAYSIVGENAQFRDVRVKGISRKNRSRISDFVKDYYSKLK
jgi:hypothetical protein